jgi:hypothetical protein
MGLHVADRITFQDFHYVFEGELMIQQDLIDSFLHERHEMVKLLSE